MVSLTGTYSPETPVKTSATWKGWERNFCIFLARKTVCFCSGDNSSNPVQSEELFSLDENWEQVGDPGNYLIYDPTDEEPNEEVAYLEFNNDNSQFTTDTGEVIQIWERQ